MGKDEKPVISFTGTGPFIVKGLHRLIGSFGEDLPVQPVMTLCRCGASKRKPCCDGAHTDVGFVGDKRHDRMQCQARDYVGRGIIIHDNRGVCSHDGSCLTLAKVFSLQRRPWINPDGAPVNEIIRVIEKCPSGALSYTLEGKLYNDLHREPQIKAAANGPLEVVGGIILQDDTGDLPEALEHYCLCRCGRSKNKPFCDGAHLNYGFED